MLAAPSRHKKKGQQAQDFLAALKRVGAPKDQKNLNEAKSDEDEQKDNNKGAAFTFDQYDTGNKRSQTTDDVPQGAPPSPNKKASGNKAAGHDFTNEN